MSTFADHSRKVCFKMEKFDLKFGLAIKESSAGGLEFMFDILELILDSLKNPLAFILENKEFNFLILNCN